MSSTRGFSLLETTIAIGIFILMALAMYDLWISNDFLVRSQIATIDVVGSASALMTDVQNYVLQADAVATSHTFSGTSYTSTTTTLVLELPSVDGSGNIIVGQHDYAVFYASGTTAFRRVDTGTGSARSTTTHQLSETITALTFSYNASPITQSTNVSVDVQTQESVKKKTTSTHVTGTIYLRNKQ